MRHQREPSKATTTVWSVLGVGLLPLMIAMALGFSIAPSPSVPSDRGAPTLKPATAPTTRPGIAVSDRCRAVGRFLEAEFLLSFYVQSNEEIRLDYEDAWFKAIRALGATMPDEQADIEQLASLRSAALLWLPQDAAALTRIVHSATDSCLAGFPFVNCRTAPPTDCSAWQKEVAAIDPPPWAL